MFFERKKGDHEAFIALYTYRKVKMYRIAKGDVTWWSNNIYEDFAISDNNLQQPYE